MTAAVWCCVLGAAAGRNLSNLDDLQDQTLGTPVEGLAGEQEMVIQELAEAETCEELGRSGVMEERQ